MKQEIVELATVRCREGSAIAGAAADLGSPAMGAGGVAENGQRKRLVEFLLSKLIQKQGYSVQAGSVCCADESDRCAQLASQFERINQSAARFHEIAHVEQNQRRKSQGEHRSSEHKLARKVQGIKNE